MNASPRTGSRRLLQAVLAVGLVVGVSACGGGGAAAPSPASTVHGSTGVAPPASNGSDVPEQPSTTTEPPPASSAPAPGRYRLPDSLRGVEWTRLPTTRRLVALTFDAGSNADGLPSILATLHGQHVSRATFFLTGDWVDSYPDLARRVAARFSVGNHTIDHPHLPALSNRQVVHQVLGARRTITEVTNVDTRPLFRFPYGDSSPGALRIVNDQGYVSIRWTVDTLGWEGASAGITTASILTRVLAQLQPGEIVLMHVGSSPDHSTPDASALPSLIEAIRAHGYAFTTVDRFTGRPAAM
ncbi:MAG TPA: polysaccharide deacetylase family protein [Gaiellales bacterium]|nr:polysaccharide deacetylase family protein [Gaiellales bacterium]